MAIADHFDHKPDAGFVRSYDARAARRQFQVSVALVIILATATLAVGLLPRTNKPAAEAHGQSVKSSPSPFAKSLLDLAN
jgi:hypothetical protein